MVKIFIDPGHGGNDPGATAYGLNEKDINLNIALKLDRLLTQSYKEVSTRLARTSDTTVTLDERTNMANAWGADYYLSIHINAGGGVGFESYIWNGSFSNKRKTESLRTNIHEEIVENVGWRDRGKKEANFHVLRESSMPAVLTENGFIDNRNEANEMRESNWIEHIAEAHASGIAKAFNLVRKAETEDPQETNTFYRVVTGSFKLENNARQRRYVLRDQGYNSFIVEFTHDGTTYHRVVTGSFQNKSNAEVRQKELERIGFESFLATFTL
ncbi:sporulation-specific N-acetylmuramoyl-L-alanine amidase [Paraliobacillus quinghaiensis]|uniref:Sporulation-specific N-acetylmuramoyl-L-alanine amidase n=1 Tax=Paraliobacillus quinghaiensis TaxID=470815 RepID=A0A917TTJ6_9BACI|nr:N-acetylmuramoyl-L-alanine amidase [Paraliobacillus quinghaiensis]GGM37504.1 sporulation-specific N-acetylmuramoyl-L-alanine amidase [Paraliobacillus quinghaiensis]